jgi:hypothetical protein
MKIGRAIIVTRMVFAVSRSAFERQKNAISVLIFDELQQRPRALTGSQTKTKPILIVVVKLAKHAVKTLLLAPSVLTA